MAIKFQRGDQVEVCCNEEGFKGAYFSAIVISEINPNECIVQYDTLLREDELAPLREMVSPNDLRPVPPEVPVDDFGLRDKVDAYANDGWWVGRVSKKRYGYGQGEKTWYYVRFEEGEVGKYMFSELRAHQEWVHGSWSCSNKNMR